LRSEEANLPACSEGIKRKEGKKKKNGFPAPSDHPSLNKKKKGEKKRGERGGGAPASPTTLYQDKPFSRGGKGKKKKKTKEKTSDGPLPSPLSKRRMVGAENCQGTKRKKGGKGGGPGDSDVLKTLI